MIAIKDPDSHQEFLYPSVRIHARNRGRGGRVSEGVAGHCITPGTGLLLRHHFDVSQGSKRVDESACLLCRNLERMGRLLDRPEVLTKTAEQRSYL